MNEELAVMLQRVRNSTDYKVEFVHRHNFVGCIVRDLRRGVNYYGFSKRNPVDPMVIERGEMIAITRAVREMI